MTKTREEYAAMIPDLAERENGARLFEAMLAADAALLNADSTRSQDEVAAQSTLYHEYDRRRNEVREWYHAELAKISGNDDHLQVASVEATRAYNEAPGGAIEEDDDGKALRCALSGAPIYEDDETVELGGKAILACVLLSQEQIAALTAEDDADDETEEAA